MSTPLLYAVCGLIVGILVGLTGVGGGSVMTPILVLAFGQPPAVAVGTDLLFSASTKLVATASFGFSRKVDWRIVGRLILGSVPAAGAVILWFWLDHRPPGVVDQIISRCLAVILVLAAAALLLQDSLRLWGLKFTAAWFINTERHKILLTVAAGAVLGIGVTMTSVGAGALGVAALVALYPLRLPSDRLVATDIAHALPITVMAAAGHAVLGHVDLRALACLLVGSIPGVLLATRAAIRLPPQLTRALIAIMLIVVSERLFSA
jgi:uncharacterized membrane protein YfcA